VYSGGQYTLLQDPTPDQRRALLKTLLADYNRVGITSVGERGTFGRLLFCGARVVMLHAAGYRQACRLLACVCRRERQRFTHLPDPLPRDEVTL